MDQYREALRKAFSSRGEEENSDKDQRSGTFMLDELFVPNRNVLSCISLVSPVTSS
jgi:hypothetical protein